MFLTCLECLKFKLQTSGYEVVGNNCKLTIRTYLIYFIKKLYVAKCLLNMTLKKLYSNSLEISHFIFNKYRWF